ncbi:hypothetical protein GCM10020221_35660 [Streptomyces thioluteus]|uniref:Alpha-L-arabinofuranosidase B arabinose-binding domain-containing protein n=1 Tax=Streptomyces thioluteus TaxID=66431 RepID=A0ABN3X3U6_STRTU
MDAKRKQAEREEATWVVVPALASPGCFSFESVRQQGYYLRKEHNGAGVRVSADDGTAEFREDATWCPRSGRAGTGTSFEAASGWAWLEHNRGELWVSLPP